MPTTTIDADAEVTTLINHFTVTPERQRELADLLMLLTEDTMRHQPGFIAANIHDSVDGTHVVNYAQWQSDGHFTAMLANPDCHEHMDTARALADAEPRLYTVESAHHR